MSKRQPSKKAVLAAIEDSAGIVSRVARKLGVTWNTASKYCNNWIETQQALEDERNRILDVAENAVYKSIQEGNTQDAKWLLIVKGRQRGFTDRHEVEHSGAIEQKFTLDIGEELDD